MKLSQQIPDDIVLLIGEQLISQTSNSVDGWKNRLLLLSVCKRWRYLLLSKVSSQLFVKYGDFRDKLEQTGLNEMAFADASQAVVTNADIISTDAYNYPAHLYIRLFYFGLPLKSLKTVIQKFKAIRPIWGNVSSLSINMSKRFYSPRSSIEVPGISADVPELIQQFKIVFPNVTKLEIKKMSHSTEEYRFFEKLLQEYQSQLISYSCFEKCCMKMPAFSTNLTHLEINMNSKLHGSALLAHSKTLVDLTLYGPKDTSNWAPFMADSSQRIRFSNLKTLHLNYEQLAAPASANAADSSEQMSPPTLEFPMLEHLTYQNRTRSVPFFNIAQLPPKLKSLCIRGDYNTLKYIAGIDLPQTNALTISYIQSNEYKAASELINQIFAKNPSEHLGFLCDTRSIKLNLLDICCPKLNRIRVAAPTGFYSIIEAIDKHPRLASLAFENVVPGDCSQRLTNELLTNKEGLPPFTARVVSLSLGYRELDYPQDTMLLFAKYLLLRLTYLQRVCLRNLPSSLFTEFIKTNKNRYPHLENVVWVGN